MKILYLPLKKEWYEMIDRGEKLEEYWVKSPYWKKRLLVCYGKYWVDSCGACIEAGIGGCLGCTRQGGPKFKDYDAVCFSYGYTKRRMTFECNGITFGQGRPEWGAPNHETFIIKLGERLGK